MEISIKGIDQVTDALKHMPSRLVRNAYAKALTAASVPLVEALKSETPVKTGDLKEHLVTDIEIDASGKGGHVQIGFGNQGHVARLVETGHREVGHKPDLKDLGDIVGPKPFMRLATEMAGEEAVEAFNASISESIDAGI